MSHHRDLTDVQRTVLDPLIPTPKRRKDGRGLTGRERREVLNGIQFILRSGAPWADLPDRYPPYQTCHRRFTPGPLRRHPARADEPRRHRRFETRTFETRTLEEWSVSGYDVAIVGLGFVVTDEFGFEGRPASGLLPTASNPKSMDIP
jgi:transposase